MMEITCEYISHTVVVSGELVLYPVLPKPGAFRTVGSEIIPYSHNLSKKQNLQLLNTSMFSILTKSSIIQ